MIGDPLINQACEGAYSHSQAMQTLIEAMIQAALEYHKGNIAAAGRSLGIERTTLSMMLKNGRPFTKTYRQRR